MANEFLLQTGHGCIFMSYLEDIFEMPLIATEMKICNRLSGGERFTQSVISYEEWPQQGVVLHGITYG